MGFPQEDGSLRASTVDALWSSEFYCRSFSFVFEIFSTSCILSSTSKELLELTLPCPDISKKQIQKAASFHWKDSFILPDHSLTVHKPHEEHWSWLIHGHIVAVNHSDDRGQQTPRPILADIVVCNDATGHSKLCNKMNSKDKFVCFLLLNLH